MTVQIIITVNDADCANTVMQVLEDAEQELMFDFPIVIQRNEADPLSAPVIQFPPHLLVAAS